MASALGLRIPTIPIGCLSFPIQEFNAELKGWLAPNTELIFLSVWFVQNMVHAVRAIYQYSLSRAYQSVPQHERLVKSMNNVNYLANTEPSCTITSFPRHHLAPWTASLKSSLKLTVFPWHIAVRFPRMASRCWGRETDPALIPTQYVCTSLLASGNDRVAASFTHHTELASMWVSSHGSPAQQSASKKIYCFIWHSVIH